MTQPRQCNRYDLSESRCFSLVCVFWLKSWICLPFFSSRSWTIGRLHHIRKLFCSFTSCLVSATAITRPVGTQWTWEGARTYRAARIFIVALFSVCVGLSATKQSESDLASVTWSAVSFISPRCAGVLYGKAVLSKTCCRSMNGPCLHLQRKLPQLTLICIFEGCGHFSNPKQNRRWPSLWPVLDIESPSLLSGRLTSLHLPRKHQSGICSRFEAAYFRVSWNFLRSWRCFAHGVRVTPWMLHLALFGPQSVEDIRRHFASLSTHSQSV